MSYLTAKGLAPLHSLITDKLEAFASTLQNFEYELRQRSDKQDAKFEHVSANAFPTHEVAIVDEPPGDLPKHYPRAFQ